MLYRKAENPSLSFCQHLCPFPFTAHTPHLISFSFLFSQHFRVFFSSVSRLYKNPFPKFLFKSLKNSSPQVSRADFESMDDRKEKNAWLSVPQFGDWDQKHQMPDYSLDFSKIRETRKQNKKDISRASLGNEEELVSQNNHQHEPIHPHHHEPIHPHHPHHAHHSPTGRKRFFSYFNCCVKA